MPAHAHGTQAPSLPVGETELSLPPPQIGKVFEYQVTWEGKDLLYTPLTFLTWPDFHKNPEKEAKQDLLGISPTRKLRLRLLPY